MSDVYPKFIIEYDEKEGLYLIISKCIYHKELCTNEENVLGGGWFHIDNKNNEIIFYGDSHDFGTVKIEDIIKCIEQDNVFTNPSLLYSISKEYKFFYGLEEKLKLN